MTGYFSRDRFEKYLGGMNCHKRHTSKSDRRVSEVIIPRRSDSHTVKFLFPTIDTLVLTHNTGRFCCRMDARGMMRLLNCHRRMPPKNAASERVSSATGLAGGSIINADNMCYHIVHDFQLYQPLWSASNTRRIVLVWLSGLEHKWPICATQWPPRSLGKT